MASRGRARGPAPGFDACDACGGSGRQRGQGCLGCDGAGQVRVGVAVARLPLPVEGERVALTMMSDLAPAMVGWSCLTLTPSGFARYEHRSPSARGLVRCGIDRDHARAVFHMLDRSGFPHMPLDPIRPFRSHLLRTDQVDPAQGAEVRLDEAVVPNLPGYADLLAQLVDLAETLHGRDDARRRAWGVREWVVARNDGADW